MSWKGNYLLYWYYGTCSDLSLAHDETGVVDENEVFGEKLRVQQQFFFSTPSLSGCRVGHFSKKMTVVPLTTTRTKI